MDTATQPVKAAIVPVTPFQQNCSILWCTATNKAAVVDPGGDVDRILEALKQTGVELEKIILRCLEKEASLRFTSADELQCAVHDLLSHGTI